MSVSGSQDIWENDQENAPLSLVILLRIFWDVEVGWRAYLWIGRGIVPSSRAIVRDLVLGVSGIKGADANCAGGGDPSRGSRDIRVRAGAGGRVIHHVDVPHAKLVRPAQPHAARRQIPLRVLCVQVERKVRAGLGHTRAVKLNRPG